MIGCVYIYPLRSTDDGDARKPIAGAASVLSWVRASRAELDVPLWQAVSAWLEADWPFEHVVYALARLTALLGARAAPRVHVAAPRYDQ